MRGTLSPILSHLVQTTIAAVGEKERLNRLINKYRKMLRFVEGGLNVSEIRFGLADLLITRDDPGDWKEAKTHYDFVLQHATYGYLRAAAMIGKAELAVRSSEIKEIEEAIELSKRAYKQLLSLVGESDYYSAKCLVVEAELLMKKNGKDDKKTALKLLERLFRDELSDPYFRARAITNHAELLLYDPKTDLNKELQICLTAIELLKDKPDDYFSIKAKLLQGEYIARRMARYDKSRATGIFMGIIGNKKADVDLVARAKLDLAEISNANKAKTILKDIISSKTLDSYIIEKAKNLIKTKNKEEK
ncbi:MAG: hypothetical protein WC527_03445 [Candidatus Margulisiibacteriota bacterium]